MRSGRTSCHAESGREKTDSGRPAARKQLEFGLGLTAKCPIYVPFHTISPPQHLNIHPKSQETTMKPSDPSDINKKRIILEGEVVSFPPAMNFSKQAIKKGGESFTLLKSSGCPDDLNLAISIVIS